MANRKIGTSHGWSEKRVDVIDTPATQLTPADAGKIFVLFCDAITADGHGFIYLPLLSSVDYGFAVRFVAEGDTTGTYRCHIIRHTDDDNCILGNIVSTDGSSGESANGEGNEQRSVVFLGNSLRGDEVSFTKLGNGTISWWQAVGVESDNNHMEFRTAD